jgi:hypothetical protein
MDTAVFWLFTFVVASNICLGVIKQRQECILFSPGIYRTIKNIYMMTTMPLSRREPDVFDVVETGEVEEKTEPVDDSTAVEEFDSDEEEDSEGSEEYEDDLAYHDDEPDLVIGGAGIIIESNSDDDQRAVEKVETGKQQPERSKSSRVAHPRSSDAPTKSIRKSPVKPRRPREDDRRRVRAAANDRRVAVGNSCSICNDVAGGGDPRNRPYIMFPCGHCYHHKCFEMARINAKGSECPLCYASKRFDQIVTNSSADNLVGSARMISMDSNLGCTMASMYMTDMIGTSVWRQLMSNGGVLDVIEHPEMNLWTEADPHNHTEVSRRARLTGASVTRSTELVNPYMDGRRHNPEDILADGVTAQDFVRAGVSVDDFVGSGYSLRDMYDLGFNQWPQLLTIGAHPKHLQMQNNSEVPFEVEDLVNYYSHGYESIISFIAMSLSGTATPTRYHYKQAVRYFCSIGFNYEDLRALNLVDVRQFFSFGGQSRRNPSDSALTIDSLVKLCSRLSSSLYELKSALKIDSRLLIDLGVEDRHIREMGWDETEIMNELGSTFLEEMRAAASKRRQRHTRPNNLAPIRGRGSRSRRGSPRGAGRQKRTSRGSDGDAPVASSSSSMATRDSNGSMSADDSSNRARRGRQRRAPSSRRRRKSRERNNDKNDSSTPTLSLKVGSERRRSNSPPAAEIDSKSALPDPEPVIIDTESPRPRSDDTIENNENYLIV